MTTRSPAVRSRIGSGYRSDPDLARPAPPAGWITMASLHSVRHLSRFVDSLGMRLVINASRDYSPLESALSDHYAGEVCETEVRRYRHVGSSSGLRRLLADEPDVVPLLWYHGSSCIGASEISWEGVRLDQRLAPGRLFAFFGAFSLMGSAVARKQETVLYLMAWQPPFPTHAIAAWGRDARLLPGPVAVDDRVRELGGWMFHTGAPHMWGGERARKEWWATQQGSGAP